jgi:hypothetical protein
LHSGNGGGVLNHGQRDDKKNATDKNSLVLSVWLCLKESFYLGKVTDARNPTREAPRYSQSQVDKNGCSRNALQEVQHGAYDDAQRHAPGRSLPPINALRREKHAV